MRESLQKLRQKLPFQRKPQTPLRRPPRLKTEVQKRASKPTKK